MLAVLLWTKTSALMGYGVQELRYAEPFANAIADQSAFRSWVLRRTEFAAFADEALSLHHEMRTYRSANAKYWWRSHFSEACRCIGCRGQETDLLAIFANASGERFAVHVEVKHPRDRFNPKRSQAASYPIRAECWARDETRPKTVPPHNMTTTMLLCSDAGLKKFSAYLEHFASCITFEEIEKDFPDFFTA
jgi:hypothetical protein